MEITILINRFISLDYKYYKEKTICVIYYTYVQING